MLQRDRGPSARGPADHVGGRWPVEEQVHAPQEREAGKVVQRDGRPAEGEVAALKKRLAADEVKIAQTDMRGHLEEYFQKQVTLAGLLAHRKQDALDRFNVATSAEYNKVAESSGLSLLSFALGLVPEAAALFGVLKILKSGATYFEEISEQAKAVGEGVKSVNEAVKGGLELAKGSQEVAEESEKKAAATEAQARGNFVMANIDTLSDLNEKTVNEYWRLEKSFKSELEAKIARGADVTAFLATNFPFPDGVPEGVGTKVSYQFELLLLKDWYTDRPLGKRKGS